ncbi:hypothetical protein F383_38138 [Gossypium arboreum]|uniref:Uncharacterized protein n=1 Tax=Gossypium arboreum TaxID=29729 RepID=A0A0B0MI68_GOSAR|nr:hypothetical protein F383_38138 [Gossypium arboreum]
MCLYCQGVSLIV